MRKVDIDFMFVDLDVCTRCKGTNMNLETALKTVGTVLESADAQGTVRKILVDTEDKARELSFVSSPTIRVNGRDITLVEDPIVLLRRGETGGLLRYRRENHAAGRLRVSMNRADSTPEFETIWREIPRPSSDVRIAPSTPPC